MGTHRNEAAIMEPPWVYIKPSTFMLWLLVWCFIWILDSRSGVSLTFCLVSGHLPSYYVACCLARSWREGLCLILLCFVVTVFG